MNKVDFENHWNKTYTNKEISKLGWYQDTSSPSLDIVESLNLNKEDQILIVGCGATTFVDSLLSMNYTNIVASDISEAAINILKDRLGEDEKSVTWIVDDLANPSKLKNLSGVSVWHDRAVLHFLTESIQQEQYLNLLNKVVKVGGYVIIATFALNGAAKCSGLDVRRYSAETLSEFIGDKYNLVKSFDYLYTMPSGDTRPYVYTLFNRVNE